MSTLIIADIYEGEFRSANLNTVTAAKELGAFDIAVVGADAGLAQGLGAGKILAVAGDGLDKYTAEGWTNALTSVVKDGGYDHVMIAGTTLGRDLAPRIAAALGAGMASDIVAIKGLGHFDRPTYAGNLVATVKVSSAIVVATVRGTAFDAAAKDGGDSAVESVAASSGDSKTTFVGFESAGGSDRPDLADAKVIVAGGRGTKGDFAPIENLADFFGGAIGASRAAVDAGWVPNDLQIGQTGKVVAPPLYFALGISGAIQHWAGMKDSKMIVAINKDPEAPIMELADLAVPLDLFEAAPELLAKLEANKGDLSL